MLCGGLTTTGQIFRTVAQFSNSFRLPEQNCSAVRNPCCRAVCAIRYLFLRASLSAVPFETTPNASLNWSAKFTPHSLPAITHCTSLP